MRHWIKGIVHILPNHRFKSSTCGELVLKGGNEDEEEGDEEEEESGEESDSDQSKAGGEAKAKARCNLSVFIPL